MNIFEKVATKLEEAADYIEKQETEAAAVETKEAEEKQAAEAKIREELVTPLKEKLADVDEETDEEQLEEKLNSLPIDVLKMLSKSATVKEEKADEDWGEIEATKTGSKQNDFNGYSDPIEAFAMSD